MFWHVLKISVLQYYFGCVWNVLSFFGMFLNSLEGCDGVWHGANAMEKVGTECMESVEECIAPGWEQGIFWNVLEVL